MFFCFSLDYFVLVLFAFVVLGLVASVLSQGIGWEEHLGNDLFCWVGRKTLKVICNGFSQNWRKSSFELN